MRGLSVVPVCVTVTSGSMGWVHCLCSPACLCPLLALASPSQPLALGSQLLSPLGAHLCVRSWLPSLLHQLSMVPVCRQNVISPAHCLELSSIADQSLDPACRSGLISCRGEPGHGTSGPNCWGCGWDSFFLRDAWTQRAMMNISGPSAKPHPA